MRKISLLIHQKIAHYRQWLNGKTFQKRFHELLEARPYIQGIPFWTSGFVVGIVAVLYSGSFSSAINYTQSLAETHPYYLFVISPVCLTLSVWLVLRFGPDSGGTGVPKVNYALSLNSTSDGKIIDRVLSLRTAAVVVASSLLALLGCGGLGREGPMVHIAACIFYVVGRTLRPLFPQEDHRSWILAGGAAGIAAAFNAPLAGVVFVLEELAQQHFHRFKTVVISAAIVGGVVSQWLTGKYLFIGYPKVGEVPLSSLPWAIGLGIICGAIAFIFHRMTSSSVQKKASLIFGNPLRFAFVAGILLAAIAVFVTPRTIGGGISLIQDLLFSDTVRADWRVIISRLIGTTLTFLTGCAGGFLAPSLALGASIGSYFSQLTYYDNHNLLVMVGMAAFLSAVIRAPFTAWVIVMEMTDRHSAIFPLMIGSVVSYGIVRALEDKKVES